jgi:predicted dehydrogenase
MLKVLIIGCGNIAGGFDAERPADNFPFSHAGAYIKHGGFEISACVEPDHAKRHAFMQRWTVAKGFSSITDVLKASERFDVISVCSRTSAHYHDVLAAIELKPRLIFCEKPVTPSVAQTVELVERCKASEILLIVNHTRRWDPDVIRLRGDIRNGVWGAIRTVTGIYTKGILNNGSHMIDLLHMFLGKLEVRSVGTPVWDCLPDDPTIPAFLSGPDDINVQLACGHAQDFSLFELQIVTEKGVICMEDGGLNWRIRHAIESPHFRGYRSLDAGARKSGELPAATLAAVAEIRAALTQGTAISSTGETALAAQQVCETIRNMVGTQTRLCAPPHNN